MYSLIYYIGMFMKSDAYKNKFGGRSNNVTKVRRPRPAKSLRPLKGFNEFGGRKIFCRALGNTDTADIHPNVQITKMNKCMKE